MDEYRLIARGAVNPLVIFNQFIGASIDDVDERSCNKAARIFPVNTLVLRLVYTPSVAEHGSWGLQRLLYGERQTFELKII